MTMKDNNTDRAGQWRPDEKQAAPRPVVRFPDRAGLSICVQCGSVGKPKKTARGSFLVEIGLWLLFLLPGLIYSLWRLSTKRPTCRTCGAGDSMVPLYSPRGRQLAAEFGTDAGPATLPRD